MSATLFDKHGGYAVVRQIVLALYDRLLADRLLARYFDGANMPNLVDHQTLFVSTLLGGPSSFSDERIRDAHRRLGLTDAHFDRLKAIVEQTFADFDFERSEVDVILDAVEARRPLLIQPVEQGSSL